jgi:starch phosphorylase
MASKKAGPIAARRVGGPETLLRAISGNLWWSWHPSALELFRACDPKRFAASNQNAALVARRLPARRAKRLARDPGFPARLHALGEALYRYMKGRT